MESKFLGMLLGKILILLLGIVLTYVGFVPLSRKNNPTAGDAIAVVGFFTRLLGMLLILLILLVGLL